MNNDWSTRCVLLPRDISGPEYDGIRRAGPAALAALGMGTGLAHSEWFRRSDGSVAISEVGARPPGAQFTSLMSWAHDLDMWIVLDRENNDDPLHAELGGGFSGVRAAFVFFDNGSDTPEKIYYGSHTMPDNSVVAQVYDETLYYGYSAEGLTPHLRKLVHDRDPARIGPGRAGSPGHRAETQPA